MSLQNEFWSGVDGDAYTERNRINFMDRVPFWTKILNLCAPASVLDVGCNAGWNMEAIEYASIAIDKPCVTRGCDINPRAVAEARAKGLNAYALQAEAINRMFGNGSHEMVVTSGVLIHVPPAKLSGVMNAIVQCTAKWVVAVEYVAEREEEVEYRGQSGLLWRRPFGRLYEEHGMRLIYEAEAEGFDRCRAWVLTR